MKVLVACECSGIVREAFRARGHDAWSCDIKPAEDASPFHIEGDALPHLTPEWDLLVAHPVCRYLANSGSRWLYTRGDVRDELRWAKMRRGAAFYRAFREAPIRFKAVENPVMHRHAIAETRRGFTQFVQPWWFGDRVFKSTGFELVNLPKLVPTDKLTPPKAGTAEHKEWSKVHLCPPGPEREAIRSRFHPRMADAMAAQWGDYAAAQLSMERMAA